MVDQHPIPNIDELFTRLNGGEKFSKLDFKDAFLQIELDEESKQLVVINTPLGLFRFNRMPFGIANAPAIFQKAMDQLISGIPNCAAYLDDIIITGQNEEEHLQTLKQVLERVRQFGFKCNREKCQFFQDQVHYLGYIISKNGKIPNEERVEAIKNFPIPKNVKDVESFLGKINYYGSFIPDMSTVCEPLNMLRRKETKFKWTEICNDAFDKLKLSLAEATMLVHYDPSVPLVLATDASDYGIGAVLLHQYPDKTEKPIAHASKTLNPAERGYSQIEKEGLAIVYVWKNSINTWLLANLFFSLTINR